MVRLLVVAAVLLAPMLAGCTGDDPSVDASKCKEFEDVPDERAPFEGDGDGVRVVFETTLGDYVLEMDAEHAPLSVANFLEYVDSGFYSCLTYHRVGPTFVVQGGGLYADGTQKPTRDPIPLEATTEEPNIRWSVSMARTQVEDSATSQFFINVVDNRRSLDPRGGSGGYAVFAHLIEGEDVVRSMTTVEKANQIDAQTFKPAEPIVVIRAYRE